MIPQKQIKWIILFFLSIFILGLILFFIPRHANEKSTPTIDGIYLSTARPIQNFQFTDHKGNKFTKSNLKGHWTLMFFGFTSCPKICPTTLDVLNKTLKKLKTEIPANDLPQVVFVTVDPERDSLERLNSYVTAFNPEFIGIRANISSTIAFEKQLHIVAAKFQTNQAGKDHYTINHSTEILLFNPQGEIQAYFSSPHEVDKLSSEYKSIIDNEKNPEHKIFYDLKGNKVSLFQFKGKWVVINYWASWCPNCLKEIPELNEFYKNKQGDIVLLGVNYDALPLNDLNKEVKKLHITFPVLTENPAKEWDLEDSSVLPITFILNPEGKVVKKILGENTEKSLESEIKTIIAYSSSH